MRPERWKAVFLFSLCLGVFSCGSDPREAGRLVVYCAHDAVYSEPVLRAFEQLTGIRLDIRFDTEATKSLGLVELIVGEKRHRQCDVFWNNDMLGTLRLAQEGLLAPYRSPATDRYPPAFRDTDHRWHGFAARSRVWIVNTSRLTPDRAAIEARLNEPDYSRLAIAKPLFGTTRTQYTALWELLGADGLAAWHAEWRRRGGVEASGNAAVKNLVASGACDLGLTDTDDYFLALDQGRPVAAVVYHLPNDQPMLIPNTVAMLAGTARSAEAGKLMDYLLSEEVELALASGAARQIPLGPVDRERLPAEVRRLHEQVQEAYVFQDAARASEACLNWLKREYLR